VVPFLPFDLINGRGYLALPFGAITGLVLCAIAPAISIVMLSGTFHYSG
jgi:hypothetical protein